VTRLEKSRKGLNISTKEIALISVFSSVWVVSQIYFGSIIGQVTRVHGVAQRLVGWLLMLILAELTGKFGRVSIMAAVAAVATRIVRRSASLYVWVLGLGYFLGGLTFDLLFFIPFTKNLEGKTRKVYLLTISVLSGLVVLIPYLFFKLYTLGIHSFIAFIPKYAYSTIKGPLLSFLGTFIGLSSLSKIKPWTMKIRT
jgi:hypothetical protein